jgi:hypothetical protein
MAKSGTTNSSGEMNESERSSVPNWGIVNNPITLHSPKKSRYLMACDIRRTGLNYRLCTSNDIQMHAFVTHL